MKTRLFFLILLFGGQGVGRAEELARWIVTATCHMLVLPQKLALPLVAELGDDATVEAAWARVPPMIESGEITLAAMLILKGDAGQKLMAETIEEMRYPTEYDPPKVPNKLPQEHAEEALKAWPIVGITPTAFETRNVGQTCELHTHISADGTWIDAEIAPQHVRFLRWMKFDAGRMANGERLSVEQPYFHTMKNTSSLRLRNGQRVLLGVHRTPEPDAKAFELFLLHVKAVKIVVRK